MYQTTLNVEDVRGRSLGQFEINLKWFNEDTCMDSIEIHQAILQKMLSGDVVPLRNICGWNLAYSQNTGGFKHQSWKFFVQRTSKYNCEDIVETTVYDITLTVVKELVDA